MRHNSEGNARNNRLSWAGAGAFIILWLSFGLNFFGIGDTYFFSGFQKDSEQLVVKQTECHTAAQKTQWPWQQELAHKLVAFDVTKSDYRAIFSPGCNNQALVPYDSQFGLQGRVISAAAPQSPKVYFAMVQALLAALMALVIVAWSYWVYKQFGKLPAVITIALFALSPWPAAMARNMYWVLFIAFLPMLWSWFYYPLAQTPKGRRIFYGVAALLIFIKCLCGYEYLSAVLASLVAPVLYYELRRSGGVQFRDWALPVARHMLKAGLAGVAGFVLAFAVQVIDLTPQKGSIPLAVQTVVQRAMDRTVRSQDTAISAVENFKNTLPQAAEVVERFVPFETLKQSAERNYWVGGVFSIANYLLTSVVWLPVQPTGFLAFAMQSFAVWVLLGVGLALRYIRREGYRTPAGALAVTTFFSLAGSVSWLVLARSHSMVHAHINPIVFYLPFLPMVFVLVGLYAREVVARLRAALSRTL